MGYYTFKFRLYPTPEQERTLLSHLETTRRLWNQTLGWRKHDWEAFGQSISYEIQAGMLKEWKRTNPFLRALYSQCAQEVLRRLDKAFNAFFRRVREGVENPGYPRFKKYREDGSMTYPQAYNGSVQLAETKRRWRKVYMAKVGHVPVVVHRQVPEDRRLKLCTVKRERDHTWWASFVYEVEEEPPAPSDAFSSPVGIDPGLSSLATLSNGEVVGSPSPLSRAQRRLRREQRKLSRKAKGSKNQAKQRLRLARLHARVRRRREDFLHKLSHRLVTEHDLIAWEDSQPRNLMRLGRRGMNRSFSDHAWARLGRMLEYKARRAGVPFVRVPPQYTTQDCHACGSRQKMELSQRVYACPDCGMSVDRDVNAARNVLLRGLSMVGGDAAESTRLWTGEVAASREAVPLGEAGTLRGSP